MALTVLFCTRVLLVVFYVLVSRFTSLFERGALIFARFVSISAVVPGLAVKMINLLWRYCGYRHPTYENRGGGGRIAQHAPSHVFVSCL